MSGSMKESQAGDVMIEGAEKLLLPRRPLRRILLPTDFSELSLEPLGLAVELARSTGAELHFLWIDSYGSTRPPTTEFPSDEDVRSAYWGAAPKHLHELAEKDPGIPRLHRVVEKAVEVAPAISLYAYENQIDLIVMARHQRKGLSRLFLGSVAEQVLRHAPCSVLVASRQALATPTEEPARILSAVDFSETSLEAARLAGEISNGLGADLTVVHAVSVPPAPTFYGVEQAFTPDVLSDLVQRSNEELSQFVASEFESAQWEVVTGPPAQSVLRVAGKLTADLIVVGSHGLTGLTRLLLGSVAEKVVRLSSVLVLVVRPEGWESEE